MPVYEFRCGDCNARFSELLSISANLSGLPCPRCKSLKTAKLVSKFVRGKTEDDRMDEIADRIDLMGEPDTASGMQELVREMGKAMDEDVSEEMEEMLDADLAGETPSGDDDLD